MLIRDLVTKVWDALFHFRSGEYGSAHFGALKLPGCWRAAQWRGEAQVVVALIVGAQAVIFGIAREQLIVYT